MGLYETNELLNSKANNQENEKATKWETIFANHVSDEGLLPKKS